jgi:hypothetical protein
MDETIAMACECL